MSNASSNQSFVREGTGYNGMYSSGLKDPDTSSKERNLSTTSPFLRDKGLEMDRPEGESSDDLDGVETLMDLGSSSCYPC